MNEETIIYKGKEHKIHYLHEPKYGDRGEITIAYIDIGYGKQFIGVSERSIKDRYNLNLADKVARGRLMKKIGGR